MNRRRFSDAVRKWYSIGLVLLIVYACSLPVPAHAAETWTQYGKIGPVGSSDLGKFNFPQGLAVDGSGNMYVADSSNFRIQKLDAASGTWSGIQGSGLSQLNGPADVALDSTGNIYVAEINYNRVQKLDIATNTWKAWGGTTSGTAVGKFNKPSGIAVDGSGNVYVADRDNNRIQKLPAGSDTWVVMSGLSLSSPNSVAADGAGNVYVLDTGKHRLLKLSPAGAVLKTWGKSGDAFGTALGEFKGPTKVTVGRDGNVYVADTGNDRVQKLSVNADTWSAVGQNGAVAGTGLGEFNRPWGVAVESGGTVYVSESANHRVLKLTGAAPVVFGGDEGPVTGSALGEFKTPYGVAVDSSGNLYVADALNFRIQKLPAGGSTWSSWGSWGSGNGQFLYAAAVAVDKNGNMYVADMSNHRIQKLSPTVGFLAAWGNGTTAGTALGQFNSPNGVAVDKNLNLYVADTDNHRIQKLPAGGSTWSSWGKSGNASGSGLGEFNKPKGVAVDGAGNVYVADTENDRIQKLTVSTGEWSEWKKSGGGPGSRPGEFRKPNGVAVDDSGNVYVADLANNRIQKLTLATNTWKVWSDTTQDGTDLGRFNNPTGIAVNSDGSIIYVADKNNNRIQKLVITVTAPDAPTGVAATAGNGKATVSFTPPADDGGSAITGYTVTSSPGGLTGTGTASPITVTGLTNLTAYTFTVVATNAQGDSTPSGPSASVTPAAEPGAPTGVTATTSGRQATISFTPPADDGGSVITGYTVTSNPGGLTATGSDSPITVTGLTYGTSYTFTVVAKNRIGNSAPSAPSASVTPVAAPNAPTGVAATAGNSQATISFTAPANDGGSAITGYTVTSNPGGLTATGSGSPITMTGLTNGTAYTFTVVATNGVGPSVSSAPSASVTPVGEPNAPTGVTAAAGDGQATISFTAPASDGGSAITGYTVTASPGGRTATGNGSPITMTGLTNGTAYTFTVVATNGVGPSVPSAPSAAVTPSASATVPGAPTGVTAVAGNGQATISFTAPASDGGSAITGYTITASPGGRTATGSGSPITMTGLTNGTAYTFTVVATNGVGPSVPSAPSAAVTPTASATVPGAPTGVTAVAGNEQATVSFTAPSNDGGSAITGYTVTSSPGGMTATGSGSPIAVTGLTNGTAYTFTVVATNGVGPSVPSVPSTSVTPVAAATVPGAPTGVTAVAGNGQATISFTAPANDGGSVITGYTVTASPGGRTATGSGSPITVTGLTYGTAYTFTVVATNGVGPSVPSAPSASVTLTAPAGEPGAPILQVAGVGDARVQLVWNAVAGSTGYKVYQSVTSGTYGTEIATVSGSVYGYNVTGLVNGTTYYFAVKATNAGIDSAVSNTESATPVTVPSAPTNVAAVAGNGQATVTFTAPASNGGSAITGYVVTTSQGNISVTGTASPITVTGLTNGISYTFIVKAINGAGSSVPSAESNAVTPSSPSSGVGSGGSGGDDGSTPVEPAAPSTSPSYVPGTPNTGVEILVNGKVEYAGEATTTKVDGLTVTTLMVDQKKLEDKLEQEGRNAVVTIAANAKSDVVIGELNGQMVKNMEDKQAVLEIKTGTATYTLPAAQINIDAISEQIGKTVALQDIKVRIEIAAPAAETVKVVENAAEKGKFSIVVPPLDFTVKGVYGDTVFEVERFNAYVERTIAIPDGVNPNHITTGVIVDPDGTVRHVPTKIVVIDGKYYAKINSLSNSTYTVVWHPLEFGDAADHWAKRAVNDMGSRMIVEGTGNGMFYPDRDMTRAEFAAIIVRGLGLKLEQGAAPFADVKAADWYAGAAKTAYSHQLIDGFEDGTFRPNDKITREQAMAIIAKAMAVTGLKAKLPVQAADAAIRSYQDAADVSVWARSGLADCLEAGIVSGRSGSELAPKASITRAEVAVMVQRVLQKSDLI